LARCSKALCPGQEGHRLATIFHYISLVIHASFYTLLEQISMHYWSTFLYIIETHFYTLLLAAGDAASLIAEDLLVAMYCPLSGIYSDRDGPCFHPTTPPAMTPLPSPSPMAKTAPSPCGSNLASRLGHSKVYVHFVFDFYAS